MTIRKILDEDSDHQKRTILELDGQVVDILPSLPSGYEYRLHRLSNAVNSKIVLLVVK